MEDTTAFYNNELVCDETAINESIDQLWFSQQLHCVRPKRGPQQQANNFFKVLVYNLVLVGDEALAFPMDKAAVEYQTNRYNKLGLTHNVTKYIDRLSEAGLLTLQKGDRVSRKRTTLRPTADLKQLVASLLPLEYLIANQMEAVEVRQERRRLDYDDTPETNLWRKTLKAHAELMEGVEVAFKPSGMEAPQVIPSQVLNYRRLFARGSWDCGGRLYCNAVQGLGRRSTPERQTITFDGVSTVEPDFSGQHPRMLYLLEGMTVADDVDMYDAWSGIPLSKKLDTLTPTDRRYLAKFLMLAALNAKDPADARGVARKALDNDPRIPPKDCKRLYQAMRQHHAAIAHHFSSDIGIRLQRIDSDIMLLVMAEMTARQLPCLSVHDSLICRCEDEAVAVGLMRAASAFYLGKALPVDGSDALEVAHQHLCSGLFMVEKHAAEAISQPLGLQRLRTDPLPIKESDRERDRRRRSDRQYQRRLEKDREEMENAVVL